MNAPARTLLEALPSPVNAWGTPTPYGVSRSSDSVVAAVSDALRTHVDMQRLQDLAEEVVCSLSGAEAACFCHCAAAGIVLAAAASITGTSAKSAAALPSSADALIVLQEEHAVDYGQPLPQTLRLTGCGVHLLRGSTAQRIADLQSLAAQVRVAAFVYVESQLVRSSAPLSRQDCQELAKGIGAMFIVDAAAQDWRLADRDFTASADLIVFSAQKYLAAPTCGIVIGRCQAIAACKVNLPGIGRPMKTTKEALYGLVAAILERDWRDLSGLRDRNIARAAAFASEVERRTGWDAEIQSTGMQGPFPRVAIQLSSPESAREALCRLAQLPTPIVGGPSGIPWGQLVIELTHVDSAEQAYLLHQLERIARESATVANKPSE